MAQVRLILNGRSQERTPVRSLCFHRAPSQTNELRKCAADTDPPTLYGQIGPPQYAQWGGLFYGRLTGKRVLTTAYLLCYNTYNPAYRTYQKGV